MFLSNFLFINAQGKILYVLNHAYKLDLLFAFKRRVIKNGGGVEMYMLHFRKMFVFLWVYEEKRGNVIRNQRN